MPYINKDSRKKYDRIITNLASRLNSTDNNDTLSGELNYTLFRLAKILCSINKHGCRNYARMSVVSSAMSESQAEFRRRIMAPYEDEKIEQNGDINVD